MSLDDRSITVQPKPRYQLRSNTQSFELISLSSRSSRRYHQAFIALLSSSTTHIRNSSSSYTTSRVHQSPFERVSKWGTLVIAPAFTPASYIPLQAMTSTPTYTMEVNNSFRRIEKFRGRPGNISLEEFKATFSNVVCELELKYGINYIKAFAFKQLARFVHYEALAVYNQHFLRILGAQIPNLAYAITITIALQPALQTTIAHHGIVPNNLDPIPISINLSCQQLIVVIANIPPTIDAPTFADPVGEFFRVLEFKFPVKNSEIFL